MTSLAYDRNLARVVRATPDRVELAFDLDFDHWPWLALPPQHLVLLEKFQYFGSLTALWAMKLFEPGVFTALTGFEWTCPPAPQAGYAATGVCGRLESATGKAFTFDIHAADGTLLMASRGAGVAFPNRDYKGWRAHAKQKAQAAWAAVGAAPPIAFAAPEAVGLGPDGVAFVSPLRQEGGALYVDALVTPANGFHPQHPYHTGSGDHVNAAHLFDCALQAAQLALGATAPLRCVAGSARFTRYVELGIPFRISVIDQGPVNQGEADAGARLAFQFSQLGRDNTTLEYTLQR